MVFQKFRHILVDQFPNGSCPCRHARWQEDQQGNGNLTQSVENRNKGMLMINFLAPFGQATRIATGTVCEGSGDKGFSKLRHIKKTASSVFQRRNNNINPRPYPSALTTQRQNTPRRLFFSAIGYNWPVTFSGQLSHGKNKIGSWWAPIPSKQ